MFVAVSRVPASESSDHKLCLASGGVQPRLEIRTLKNERPLEFSLFIQALSNIMKLDYKYDGTDAVNWEQICGSLITVKYNWISSKIV